MAEEEKTAPQPKLLTRKKATVIVALCLLALVSVGLTAAFTTRNVEADNIITFGSIKMQLLETELVEGAEQTVPDGHTVKAQAGVASRIIRIKNIGANDMFVRARPVMTAVKADDSDPVVVGEETAKFTMNSASWTEGEDGWWYYNEPVAAAEDGNGETTDELMSEIEFVGDFTNAVGPGGHFEFTVDAQAVQVDNQGSDGEEVTALTAVGWPADETTTTTTVDEGQE